MILTLLGYTIIIHIGVIRSRCSFYVNDHLIPVYFNYYFNYNYYYDYFIEVIQIVAAFREPHVYK